MDKVYKSSDYVRFEVHMAVTMKSNTQFQVKKYILEAMKIYEEVDFIFI
jgi:hypothetical protein